MRWIRMRGRDVAHADKCRCVHCSKDIVDQTLAKLDDYKIPKPRSLEATIFVAAHWRRGRQSRLVRTLTQKYFRRNRMAWGGKP